MLLSCHPNRLLLAATLPLLVAYLFKFGVLGQSWSSVPNLFNNSPFNLSNSFQATQNDERIFAHLYPYGSSANDIDLSDHPWQHRQIDLDFQFPYFGYRFNYTFIYPEGFIAFGYPLYIQPPYAYPNPRWPYQPDPSLICAFLTEQSFAFVGEKRISNLWFRTVHRSRNRIGFREEDINAFLPPNVHHGFPNNPRQKSVPGRVEDDNILNAVSRDISEGMVGARGFVADFALIVTWERMGYGGVTRYLQLERYKEILDWQNTYQLVIATDEIRSFVVFNYGHINWTSSAAAGAPNGRGGRQSALVGFNGGNGTGFVELPYSGGGQSYKLVTFGSANVAGRWLARVDEEIVFGGCHNDSTGKMSMEIDTVSMIGGHAVNLSGPCFKPTDLVRLQLEEFMVDCQMINMVKAHCSLPPDVLFRAGYYPIGLSVNAGQTFQWWSYALVASPERIPLSLRLMNDPINMNNQWRSSTAENLTIRWSASNISTLAGANVDIVLWGYWEDVTGQEFKKIATVAKNIFNTGSYSFNPRTLNKSHISQEDNKKFNGGVVQVRLSNFDNDFGDRAYWSEMLPFNWYLQEVWEASDGPDWALKRCIEWFDYDGQRENFYVHVENDIPCPCTMAQALADFGRFVNYPTCDIEGNIQCTYVEGAALCVISTTMSVTGAAQMCCYDDYGYLMLSQDYEYTMHYLRFFGAGFPYRSHPWGMYPYRRPPFVPGLSNFHNDLLPYEICCFWAEHCEFFYWRRSSSGCQGYQPPALGFAYGHGHFRTFDGSSYDFYGKGYYILTKIAKENYDLMIQIRMEKPEHNHIEHGIKTTVITALCAQENGSAVVQIFARKTFRRWRYKLDVYVDGMRVFFDKYHKKLQFFHGVALRSPTLNMDMSEIEVMFRSGVGVKVRDIDGSLQLTVSMPQKFRIDQKRYVVKDNPLNGRDCQDYPVTFGLLGVFDGQAFNDLTSSDCSLVQINAVDSRNVAYINQHIFYHFGETWRLDIVKQSLLFDTKFRPLYDPIDFSLSNFTPSFDLMNDVRYQFAKQIIDQDLHIICRDSPACALDYLATGSRTYAKSIRKLEDAYAELQQVVSRKLISCGPLQKAPNVLKSPLGNNYLDGITVTMTCKPNYFAHGTPVRQCRNGTWSPGWHVWCRTRKEENALKWITGVITACITVVFFSVFFYYLYRMRVQLQLQSPSQAAH